MGCSKGQPFLFDCALEKYEKDIKITLDIILQLEYNVNRK